MFRNSPSRILGLILVVGLSVEAIYRLDALDLPGIPGQPPPGFTLLFNGKNLRGWKEMNGHKDSWGAARGILFTTGEKPGWLMTTKEYGDFELRLEYRVVHRGNSGVALRSPPQGDPAYLGMEIQILDDAGFPDYRPDQYTGAIYDVAPPTRNATRPAGEWNQMRIMARGRQVQVELNGNLIVDVGLDAFPDRLGRHVGLLRTRGHLGLQSHDGRVDFRHLYLKSLEESGPSP